MNSGAERGLICDLSDYELWCRKVAEEIAGKEIEDMTDLIFPDHLPVVIKMSFNSILNGINNKMKCTH
jgi:hypothetical protein